MSRPVLAAFDLESVLVPEIWHAVAEQTDIEELRLTTRDLPDYDRLMEHRLSILRRHEVKFSRILDIVEAMEPLPGAVDFLQEVRSRNPAVILSDTFYRLAAPLLNKLNQPLLLGHTLEIAPDGTITGYRLRHPDAKREAVRAFQQLGFLVVAVGDSHNDLTMLGQADKGVLFHPPAGLAEMHPFPVAGSFEELRSWLF